MDTELVLFFLAIALIAFVTYLISTGRGDKPDDP